MKQVTKKVWIIVAEDTDIPLEAWDTFVASTNRAEATRAHADTWNRKVVRAEIHILPPRKKNLPPSKVKQNKQKR